MSTTTLVTGANRGIGLELTRQCQARGDRVIAVCRKTSAALDALKVEVIQGIDVGTKDAGQKLARALEGRKIDLLINNAGILKSDRLESLSFEAVQEQIEVNAVGPLRITAALRENLADGGKIALITSRMGSIADNSSGGHYGYRMSKAALNAAGVSLARDLAPRKITVALLHPGMVKTDMTGSHGVVEPEVAVKGLLARIAELTLGNSGGFWHMNGEMLPW